MRKLIDCIMGNSDKLLSEDWLNSNSHWEARPSLSDDSKIIWWEHKKSKIYICNALKDTKGFYWPVYVHGQPGCIGTVVTIEDVENLLSSLGHL